MMKMTLNLLFNILFGFKKTFDIVLENLALRQQLATMKRCAKRPQLRASDRLFWIILSRFWTNWRQVLIVVKPETVVRWHKKGFKLFWKFKSRRKGPGRPPVSPEIRDLILKMANANPLWGAPRIHGELLKLGIEISERTVSNLMPRRKPKPPSQTWRTFLKNHMMNMVSIDFFTVPTATFRILFVLLILSHSRRRVVHFNVTANPTANWTAQQIIEAFPWDTAPRYLLRDRDSIYGSYFRRRLKNMGINEIMTAPRSPWQNPFVERLIRSIRNDCLDHVIVLNESHLKRILSSYFRYYHNDRSHYRLEKDTPSGRPVQARPAESSKIIELPRVGGLHHRYEWRQAA
jgi:transposase InsO family protein